MKASINFDTHFVQLPITFFKTKHEGGDKWSLVTTYDQLAWAFKFKPNAERARKLFNALPMLRFVVAGVKDNSTGVFIASTYDMTTQTYQYRLAATFGEFTSILVVPNVTIYVRT